jgi:glycosyltransferase involved in cell wall biosynthesis
VFVALDATYLVDPHPSGIAIYSRELLDGLAQKYPDNRFLHLYRLKQYRRAAPSKFANVNQRLLLPPLSPAALWRQPDLFHALNQRIDMRPAKKVVVTFHDLFVMTGEYSSADFRTRFTQQAKRAAQKADLIIAVSQFTSDQITTHLKVDARRIRVVPHGIHSPDAVPSLEKRDRTILCVGALQVRKNVVRLVEAFEKLPADVAAGWKLVLAGSTAGFGAAEIVARIESSPRLSQIQLSGYVSADELKDLYQRASIFAFPSLDEGFGIPVLEAMANGIPVLTSNRSALPQVAGDAALIVDPYDSDALSSALKQLIESDPLKAELRAAGLERAKLFSWDRTVLETYRVYSELVD